MPKGIIISNISNLYHVETEDGKIYSCNARGKFKVDDISPVAGDKVEIEIIDMEAGLGIINKIEDRVSYIKRPKIANISQIILVVSMKLPKPDLELLDKQLAYSEYMRISPIIVLNKVDLESENKIEEIAKTYEKIGYTVIKTVAKDGVGIETLNKILKQNITAFSGNSGVRKIYIN